MDSEIKQLYISKALEHLKKRVVKKLHLNDYESKEKNTLFFGIYNKNDLNVLNNHKGNKYLMFGGSDCYTKLIPKIEKIKIVKIYAISNDIYNEVKKYFSEDKIEYYDLDLVDYEIFKPIEIYGKKIFVCDGISKKNPKRRKIYNLDMIEEIMNKLPKYKFIFSSELNYPNEKMPEIYKKCFIGLRLTNKDGNCNTVKEMKALRIPIIHNQSDYGIKWNSINDIVFKIKNNLP